jgi:mannose-1-phosphate guanylyltransferase / mannose-6-phosphate isomerase
MVQAQVSLVTENYAVYSPLGSRHRLEGTGKLPMVLIEMQTGVYLAADDRVRYEDGYGRW